MRVDKPEHKIIHSRQTLVKTARGGSQDFVRQTVNRKMIMNKQQIVDKEFVVQKISMTESTPRQLLFLGDKDQNVGQEKNVVGDNQLSQRKIGMANRKIKSFRISGLS